MICAQMLHYETPRNRKDVFCDKIYVPISDKSLTSDMYENSSYKCEI